MELSSFSQQQHRILIAARERFIQMQGFSKVTMDEIAGDLGMSKKTLYKFFPNKKALLRAVIDLTLEELRIGSEAHLKDQTKSFPQRLQSVMLLISQTVMKFINRDFLQDVQRFAPEIWQHIDAFRDEMIHTRFAEMIRQGVESGYFRDDIDRRVVVLVYLSAIHDIMNPQVLSELPLTSQQVFDSIVSLLLNGLMTDAARAGLKGVGGNE